MNEMPLVSILCTTFNHEAYIKYALEGFVAQKTNFSFEIIVHDDASTDNTANIIKDYESKYPELFRNIYQTENQYSKGNGDIARIVYASARGKYIAFCEGDDYWTDPFKLQKQVDFLENNPDYGLIHTELDHFYTATNTLIKNHWAANNVNKQSGEIYDSLMVGKESMIYLCTVCLRTEFVQSNEFNEIIDQNFLMGDYPISLFFSLKSKIGYLKESTAVRNVLLFSATQGRSFEYSISMIRSGYKVFEYFDKKKPVGSSDRKLILNRYYLKQMQLCYNFNRDKKLYYSCYDALDNEFKTKEIALQRLEMRNEFFRFFILVAGKLHRRILKYYRKN